MKIIGVIASVLITSFSIGQKSYYFSDPVPSEELIVQNVDAKYFGLYTTTTGRAYEFSEVGIHAISTSVSSMSRETIRESSKYSVRNGFIHGVVLNDSIPCVLEGENYFFGVKNRDLLVGVGSSNVLTKSGGSYYINVKDEGVFFPMKLDFAKKSLQIKYFDYDFETTIFDGISEKKSIPSEYNEMIILQPTKEEFSAISSEEIFPSGVELKKSK